MNPTFLSLAIACSLLQPAPGSEGDVIINEIMYHPPRDREQLQYVELFHRGSTEADLSGWSFSRGIKFVFPKRTTMAPGSYLIVCRSRAAFRANYGADKTALGDFTRVMMSRMVPMDKVEMPLASIRLATRPTVSWHHGQ